VQRVTRMAELSEDHKIKVLEAEIAALKEANANLRLVQCSSRSCKPSLNSGKHRRDLDVSRSEVAALANAIVSKDQRIHTLEASLGALECAVKELQVESAKLHGQLCLLRAEKLELEKRLGAAEVCIVELSGRVEILRVEIAALHVELECARKNERVAKQEYDIAKKEEKRLEKTLSTAEERVAALLHVIDTLTEEVRSLKHGYHARVAQVAAILEKPLGK
jgi:chromosome segregation ATPase